MKNRKLSKNKSTIIDDYCLDRRSTLIKDSHAVSVKECRSFLRSLRSSFDDSFISISQKWSYEGIVSFCIQVKSAVFPPHFSRGIILLGCFFLKSMALRGALGFVYEFFGILDVCVLS
jgi:hypothetical protein